MSGADSEEGAGRGGAGSREPGAAGAASRGGGGSGGSGRLRQWALGLFPLLLLGAALFLFARHDPADLFREVFPPVEELTIDRVTFPESNLMRVHVVNGGPEPVTIAQVMVDEAYWEHRMEGSHTVKRLGKRTIEVPYPWVKDEPHEVTLVTSTGVTFTHEVEVATRTPEPNLRYLGTFALLGLYAGMVPVAIGLLWYPFLGGLNRKWLHFFLSLTVGLLVFLAVDGFEAALESAERLAGAYQGPGLVAVGILGAILALRAAGNFRRGGPGSGGSGAGGSPAGDGDGPSARLRLAWMVALGIGLHNLGEGLAIGAAYTAGELALGSFLVIGFAVHNTTEGLGIVAPVARDRPSLWHLAGMGALAGLPTVAGTWIGGFSYDPVLTTLFLALGVGAIAEVSWEIGRLVWRKEEAVGRLFSPLNAAGLGLGLLVMYGTALFVAA